MEQRNDAGGTEVGFSVGGKVDRDVTQEVREILTAAISMNKCSLS